MLNILACLGLAFLIVFAVMLAVAIRRARQPKPRKLWGYEVHK